MSRSCHAQVALAREQGRRYPPARGAPDRQHRWSRLRSIVATRGREPCREAKPLLHDALVPKIFSVDPLMKLRLLILSEWRLSLQLALVVDLLKGLLELLVLSGVALGRSVACEQHVRARDGLW